MTLHATPSELQAEGWLLVFRGCANKRPTSFIKNEWGQHKLHINETVVCLNRRTGIQKVHTERTPSQAQKARNKPRGRTQDTASCTGGHPHLQAQREDQAALGCQLVLWQGLIAGRDGGGGFPDLTPVTPPCQLVSQARLILEHSDHLLLQQQHSKGH